VVGIEWRDKVVVIEWTRGYEGEKTFERGTFDFGGSENFLILGDCIGAFSQGRDWKTVILVLA
jgi:hypothetical protein